MLSVRCQNIWQKKSFSHRNYYQNVRAFHRRTTKRQQWDQIVLLPRGRLKYYNPFMLLSNENRLIRACNAVFKLNIVGKWARQAKSKTTNLTFMSKKNEILFTVEFHSIYLWSASQYTYDSKAALQKIVAEKNSLVCLRRWGINK